MEGFAVAMYCSAILKGDLHLGVVVDSVEAERGRPLLGVTGVTGADKENEEEEGPPPEVAPPSKVSGTLGEVAPNVDGVVGLRDGFSGKGATIFLINGEAGDEDAGEGGGRSNVTDFTSSAFT